VALALHKRKLQTFGRHRTLKVFPNVLRLWWSSLRAFPRRGEGWMRCPYLHPICKRLNAERIPSNNDLNLHPP